MEIVRRLLAGFREGGAEDLPDDALREFFDPRVEWVPIPEGVLAGGEYRGYEGVRRFWPISLRPGMRSPSRHRTFESRAISSSLPCE